MVFGYCNAVGRSVGRGKYRPEACTLQDRQECLSLLGRRYNGGDKQILRRRSE